MFGYFENWARTTMFSIRVDNLRNNSQYQVPIISFSNRSKLRNFLSHVQPKAGRNMERWIDKLKFNAPSVDMGIRPSESLPPGSNAPWPT